MYSERKIFGVDDEFIAALDGLRYVYGASRQALAEFRSLQADEYDAAANLAFTEHARALRLENQVLRGRTSEARQRMASYIGTAVIIGRAHVVDVPEVIRYTRPNPRMGYPRDPDFDMRTPWDIVYRRVDGVLTDIFFNGTFRIDDNRWPYRKLGLKNSRKMYRVDPFALDRRGEETPATVCSHA